MVQMETLRLVMLLCRAARAARQSRPVEVPVQTMLGTLVATFHRMGNRPKWKKKAALTSIVLNDEGRWGRLP